MEKKRRDSSTNCGCTYTVVLILPGSIIVVLLDGTTFFFVVTGASELESFFLIDIRLRCIIYEPKKRLGLVCREVASRRK